MAASRFWLASSNNPAAEPRLTLLNAAPHKPSPSPPPNKITKIPQIHFFGFIISSSIRVTFCNFPQHHLSCFCKINAYRHPYHPRTCFITKFVSHPMRCSDPLRPVRVTFQLCPQARDMVNRHQRPGMTRNPTPRPERLLARPLAGRFHHQPQHRKFSAVRRNGMFFAAHRRLLGPGVNLTSPRTSTAGAEPDCRFVRRNKRLTRASSSKETGLTR